MASFNLKGGLYAIITKFGKFGLNASATKLKISDSGPYDEFEFGPRTICAKFGLSGTGSAASTSFSGVASFKFCLSRAFYSYDYGL